MNRSNLQRQRPPLMILLLSLIPMTKFFMMTMMSILPFHWNCHQNLKIKYLQKRVVPFDFQI